LALGVALVPFAVAPRVAASACAPVARRLAESLRFIAWVLDIGPTGAKDEPEPALGAEPPTPEPPAPAWPPVAKSGPRRPRHIEVSAAAVRQAVRSGHRPTGILVGPSGAGPAGIRIESAGVLHGIARPGDTIVACEGQAVTSWEILIGCVRAAYDRGDGSVAGTVWRSGETLGVRVHLPR
jgi:hypothetical protein